MDLDNLWRLPVLPKLGMILSLLLMIGFVYMLTVTFIFSPNPEILGITGFAARGIALITAISFIYITYRNIERLAGAETNS